MLRVYIKAVFTQIPNAAFPNRNLTFVFPGVHEFECADSWADLTNKGKIMLAKNIVVSDGKGGKIRLGTSPGDPVSNKNLGGFGTNDPLFLKGDQIIVTAGYRYFDRQGNEVLNTNQWYQGFVTNVQSRLKFELDLEDNMYLLKKVNAPTRFWPGKSTTVESMLSEMIKESGLPFTVNQTTSTVLGDFRTTSSETICEVLARLHKDFHFEAYFRGNELRCGSFVYIEQDAIDDGKKVFKFQQDIIEDDLVYKRKDDLTLSAIASNYIHEETGETTKDGKAKTRKKRIEVLVTYRNNAVSVNVKEKGKDYPPNTDGERRSLVFLGAQTTDQLAFLATNELKKYYYTGLHGHFTTFGMPLVRMGDNVDLIDSILPERSGRYKVKSVNYSGGVGGLRQKIELHYLISHLDAKGNTISKYIILVTWPNKK